MRLIKAIAMSLWLGPVALELSEKARQRWSSQARALRLMAWIGLIAMTMASIGLLLLSQIGKK